MSVDSTYCGENGLRSQSAGTAEWEPLLSTDNEGQGVGRVQDLIVSLCSLATSINVPLFDEGYPELVSGRDKEFGEGHLARCLGFGLRES